MSQRAKMSAYDVALFLQERGLPNLIRSRADGYRVVKSKLENSLNTFRSQNQELFDKSSKVNLSKNGRITSYDYGVEFVEAFFQYYSKLTDFDNSEVQTEGLMEENTMIIKDIQIDETVIRPDFALIYETKNNLANFVSDGADLDTVLAHMEGYTGKSVKFAIVGTRGGEVRYNKLALVTTALELGLYYNKYISPAKLLIQLNATQVEQAEVWVQFQQQDPDMLITVTDDHGVQHTLIKSNNLIVIKSQMDKLLTGLRTISAEELMLELFSDDKIETASSDKFLVYIQSKLQDIAKQLNVTPVLDNHNRLAFPRSILKGVDLLSEIISHEEFMDTFGVDFDGLVAASQKMLVALRETGENPVFDANQRVQFPLGFLSYAL